MGCFHRVVHRPHTYGPSQARLEIDSVPVECDERVIREKSELGQSYIGVGNSGFGCVLTGASVNRQSSNSFASDLSFPDEVVSRYIGLFDNFLTHILEKMYFCIEF